MWKKNLCLKLENESRTRLGSAFQSGAYLNMDVYKLSILLVMYINYYIYAKYDLIETAIFTIIFILLLKINVTITVQVIVDSDKLFLVRKLKNLVKCQK